MLENEFSDWKWMNKTWTKEVQINATSPKPPILGKKKKLVTVTFSRLFSFHFNLSDSYLPTLRVDIFDSIVGQLLPLLTNWCLLLLLFFLSHLFIHFHFIKFIYSFHSFIYLFVYLFFSFLFIYLFIYLFISFHFNASQTIFYASTPRGPKKNKKSLSTTCSNIKMFSMMMMMMMMMMAMMMAMMMMVMMMIMMMMVVVMMMMAVVVVVMMMMTAAAVAKTTTTMKT